jgi:hypothetical protein
LTTVLAILKIIGIVLLAVLGLLLLLVLLVLLVPIRYRASGYRRNAKKGIEQRVKLRAGWLLGLLRVMYTYPEKPYLVVKLCIFTLYNAKRKQEKEEKRAEKERKAAEKERAKLEKGRAKLEKKAKEKAAEELTEPVNTIEEAGDLAEGADNGFAAEEQAEESPQKNPLITLYEKITKVIQNITYTSKQIYDKINNNDLARYLKIIQSARFQRAFARCKHELGRIWRAVRPRRIQAEVLFGTDDPALTGQVLEVYCLLYPLIGRNVRVMPDFTKQVLTGDFLVAGRITTPKLLWAAWRLYRDKNIRAVLRQFEEKEETEEKEKTEEKAEEKEKTEEKADEKTEEKAEEKTEEHEKEG